MSSNLTLNLGLRYDLIWNSFAQNVVFPPFEQPGRPQDANNMQPRVGFAYQVNDRTVIRGGSGLYYNDILNTNVLWPQSPLTIAVIRVNNDGRADFAANPFNGPLPTYAQALQRFCYINPVPGCLLRDLQEQAPIPDYAHVTHAWQNSIGVVHQFGSFAALQVDYVNTKSRDEKSIQDNVNITFNPATGIPYPYSDVAHRAFPLYGVVGMIPHIGSSDYHGLQTSFTKRMSNNWQGSLSYTLGGLWDQDPPPLSGFNAVTFPVAPEPWQRTVAGGDRPEASAGLQRHLGGGTRLPGERHLFLRVRPADAGGMRLRCARAADHQYRSSASGWDDYPAQRVCRRPDSPCRDASSAAGEARRTRGDQRVLEVFNLFNHANYDYSTYNVTETSPGYRAARIEPESLVRAANRAIGVQTYFLKKSWKYKSHKVQSKSAKLRSTEKGEVSGVVDGHCA